ncbi:hypothetical protein [Halorussus ruber]|uniref:hypothetical protein n=1 Tax=Halorussus ruber TaxID=1126238 RepID=UPI00143DCD7D|nr:hypothetical protein [Halorussus ruber]
MSSSVGFLPDLKGRGIRLVPPVKLRQRLEMSSKDARTDDESEPATKTSRYLRIANLVVRFITNVVKLLIMLTS